MTGVYTATLNGNPYQVQVFERARFEYHPENPAPYRVLLGLLGRESLTPAVQETSVIPTATAIPSANTDLSASFVVADYLATKGILPESDLRHYRNDFSIIDLEGGWTVTDKITTMIDNPFSYKMLEPGRRFGGRVAFMIPSSSAPGQLVAQFSYEQPVTVELRVWPHVN